VERARESVAELQQRADLMRENEAADKRFFAEVVSTRKQSLVPTIAEIEKLAAEPGLKAGARSFSPEILKDAPLLKVAVGVTLTGGYRQLVDFLRGLERSRHFVTVDRVQLQAQEEDSGIEGALGVQLSAWFRAEGEAVDGR
jgi:Tfp pilus assembly protein PilO